MKAHRELHRSSSALLLLILCFAFAPASAATVWYVDGLNGNDSNDCLSTTTACQTIGHAIALASSGDTIGVGPATYYETLTINISLKIIGSDAATTIVDGNQAGTVFIISKGTGPVVLSKLTIRNGVWGSEGAGGIYNSGTLTINSSTISGNWVDFGAGGIYNSNSLTINSSTISGNQTWGGGAGGIYNTGILAINNSTISGNLAAQALGGQCAGGLYDRGTLTVTNSTISGNTGQTGGRAGGIVEFGALRLTNSTVSGNQSRYGGGIACGGECVIQNSILAYNHAYIHPRNCFGSGWTSLGYNLSTDDSCNFNGPGDMNNVLKAKLGPLGNYGGPTQTIPLRCDSPAVDAGNPNGCTDSNGNLLQTDQRGWPRPGKGDGDVRCDIGAYERQKK